MKEGGGNEKQPLDEEMEEFKVKMTGLLEKIPEEFYPLIVQETERFAEELRAEKKERQQRIRTERAGKIFALPSQPKLA